MDLDFRKSNDVIIIELGGKIMGGSDSAKFFEQLGSWLDEGYRRFVMDLGHVDWMNSSGLGILIRALKTIRDNQGSLRLANLTEKIKDILTITKLLVVFQTYGSLDEAIESF
jgi:anti-sigma B factor antagonist